MVGFFVVVVVVFDVDPVNADPPLCAQPLYPLSAPALHLNLRRGGARGFGLAPQRPRVRHLRRGDVSERGAAGVQVQGVQDHVDPAQPQHLRLSTARAGGVRGGVRAPAFSKGHGPGHSLRARGAPRHWVGAPRPLQRVPPRVCHPNRRCGGCCRCCCCPRSSCCCRRSRWWKWRCHSRPQTTRWRSKWRRRSLRGELQGGQQWSWRWTKGRRAQKQ
mmetsp:Transcript_11590/g.22990  ORF Transcript_11590/g.22990 Transcript_11590/m.22990 type:complete len:217 (+) Transcript_11590:343-993(+)